MTVRYGRVRDIMLNYHKVLRSDSGPNYGNWIERVHPDDYIVSDDQHRIRQVRAAMASFIRADGSHDVFTTYLGKFRRTTK